MKNQKLISLLEAAIFGGIAFVLSLIPIQTINLSFDLALSCVAIGILALRRGVKYGILAGLTKGMLSILFGKAYFLSVVQVILEYPIAFGLAGFLGIFSSKIHLLLFKKEKIASLKWLIFSAIIGTFTRYLAHFWAGIVFWGSYAPKGWSPYLYSFVVNGIGFVANSVFMAIVFCLIALTSSRLILPKYQKL